MRFKPRTDIERIYYTVNEYSLGKISKKVVNDHLEKMNINNIKKITQDESINLDEILEKNKDLDTEGAEELQKQKEFMNRQGYDEKNSETVKQIEQILASHNKVKGKDSSKGFENSSIINNSANKTFQRYLAKDNSAIRRLNKDMNLNNKTFFKAAQIYSLKLDEYKKNLKKRNYSNDLANSISTLEKKIEENQNEIDLNMNVSNNNILKINKPPNLFNKFSTTSKKKKEENNQSFLVNFDKRDEPNKTEEDFPEEELYGSFHYDNNCYFNQNIYQRKLFKNSNLDKDNSRSNNISNFSMTSNFFNPNRNNENEESVDKDKLSYLKRISTSTTLITNDYSNDKKASSHRKEYPKHLSSFIKEKKNEDSDKKFNNTNSMFNYQVNKTKNATDNIFVKTNVLENEETRKCEYFTYNI